jgi:transcriptional regulator with XRE-family HTH domain
VILHDRFRTKLALALQERGWSQSELARRMSMSQPNVGDYLHGRRCPGLDTVERFAIALGCEPENLIDDHPLRLIEAAAVSVETQAEPSTRKTPL